MNEGACQAVALNKILQKHKIKLQIYIPLNRIFAIIILIKLGGGEQ